MIQYFCNILQKKETDLLKNGANCAHLTKGCRILYKQTLTQLTVYDYIAPIEELLTPENRWVKLAQQVDWISVEEEYAAHFSHGGKQAFGVRVAFGSLVVKKALHLSDQQTALLIGESPYLQYFLGMNEFRPKAPFSARTMASFRRRIPDKVIAEAVRELNRCEVSVK